MPSSHVATGAASTTVYDKPAMTSLPSPPMPLQVPASNHSMEPPLPPPPVGFAAGQMYPAGFHPQLWTGVTPTSEWVYSKSSALLCIVLMDFITGLAHSSVCLSAWPLRAPDSQTKSNQNQTKIVNVFHGCSNWWCANFQFEKVKIIVRVAQL